MTAVPGSGTATVRFPTGTDILITRDFAAPRHLVYRAWTTPELVRRWWGGHRGQVTSAEIDLRVGGAWRYAMRAGDGSEVAFGGEYREIVPGERIVHTEMLEGIPNALALTKVTFSEAGGHTTVTILVRYEMPQDRDAHATYMQDGLQEVMDLLERTVTAMASRA